MAGTPHEDPLQSWVTSVSDAKDLPQKQYQRGILEEVTAFRLRTHAEATRCARESILHIVGALTERFGAKSAWLFLKTADSPDPQTPWITQQSKLMMEFRHNTQSLENDRTVTTPGMGTTHGITGYVALTRRPYLCNDIRLKGDPDRDPHYRDIGKNTKSELAVPILIEDNEGLQQLLGVLNLESDNPHAFLDAYKGELLAAATELAPHVLIWHYLRQHPHGFGWHPDVHGWTLDRLLKSFCSAVAGPTDPSQRFARVGLLPPPSCTIWHRDQQADPQRMLHVRATARFDYEYHHQRRLPEQSFAGAVAKLPPGKVGRGTPQDLTSDPDGIMRHVSPAFQRRAKAASMGLAYAVAHPLAQGALNLYFFQEELNNYFPDGTANFKAKKLDDLFPTRLAQDLADTVNELMSECELLRADVASAFLQFRLCEHALSMVSEFDVIKEVVLQCVDAEWCSIFTKTGDQANSGGSPQGPAESNLQCVASTGLTNYDGIPIGYDSAAYETTADGLTPALAAAPDKCIRLDSVSVRGEFEFNNSKVGPANTYREAFSLGLSEHRPYLGIGVSDHTRGNTRALGVIRLGRRYPAPPFIESDEKILQRLARVCAQAFVRQRERPLTKPLIQDTKHGEFSKPIASRALQRLRSPRGAGELWKRGFVEGVLLDLINIFGKGHAREKPKGGFMANLRLKMPWAPAGNVADALHIYAIHSLSSIGLPDEQTLQQHRERENIGKFVMQHSTPVTYSRNECKMYTPILEESNDVRTGVNFPVRSISSNGIVHGVLSVDTDHDALAEWEAADIEAIACAAKRLDFLGCDNRLSHAATCTEPGWIEASRRFLTETIPNATVGVDVGRSGSPPVASCELFVSDDGKLIPLRLAGHGDATVNEIKNRQRDQMPLFEGDPEEASAKAEKGSFSIPLWFGPFRTSLVLAGLLHEGWDRDFCDRLKSDELVDTSKSASEQREQLERWRKILLRTIVADLSHLWNRFVAGNVRSGEPFCRASFTPQAEKKGIVIWNNSIELCDEIQQLIDERRPHSSGTSVHTVKILETSVPTTVSAPSTVTQPASATKEKDIYREQRRVTEGDNKCQLLIVGLLRGVGLHTEERETFVTLMLRRTREKIKGETERISYRAYYFWRFLYRRNYSDNYATIFNHLNTAGSDLWTGFGDHDKQPKTTENFERSVRRGIEKLPFEDLHGLNPDGPPQRNQRL